MTENKRFRMTETELIFMVLDNETPLSRKEIVDKLNNFNDENEQLKKENKVLQSKLQMFMNVVEEDTKIIEKCNKLLEENEQLKKIKNQYKGQKEFLLWAIERNCPKDFFDTVKSYLIDVEDFE